MNIDALNEKVSHYAVDGSIYSFEHEGNLFWLKTQGEEKRNSLRILSGWLAKRPQLGLFSVNSALSPAERMKLEISHLQEMNKKGLAVPPVLLKEDYFFLTPDCGRVFSDPELLNEVSLKDMKIVFQTLATFHNAGCYHGRPALRDIALPEDGAVIFLDLEESGVDSNATLMARDVFLLLSDLKRIPQFTIDDKLELLHLWAGSLESKQPIDELRKIQKLIGKLAFIAKTVLYFKSNRTSVNILDSLHVLDRFYTAHKASSPEGLA
uniref:Serine/threonine protein kinase n=1 Tax=uncultured Thiotrichaceae bacterium TaxID=298394 RepID=A0A6S6UNP3_9GAMM|nr:MAG: Unknown protein [uncultured Thiotrichaceae bacterium]